MARSLARPGRQRMDELYGLSASRNSEVLFRWSQLCLRAEAEFVVPTVVRFISEQGRMKVHPPARPSNE